MQNSVIIIDSINHVNWFISFWVMTFAFNFILCCYVIDSNLLATFIFLEITLFHWSQSMATFVPLHKGGMPFSKGGTIYRYDWYRILFSPSIYRIEEVDQISPYRNCVILALCVWFYDRIGSPYIIMRCSRSLFSKRFMHAYMYVDPLY